MFAYRYENGRRYHAYREGAYPLPNDDTEQDRLDLLHHIFKLCNGGQLYRAPVPENIRRALDFGTGTGIWAIDFADEFPHADIIGTDLSPIQPSWVPRNLSFMVDDVEQDWTFGHKFDYIHGRGMAGSIASWVGLYKTCLENLEPGGYLEMQEYEGIAHSDDGGLERCPHLQELVEKLEQASSMFGKQMNEAPNQKKYMEDAGFENVQDDIFKVKSLLS